MLPTSQFTYTAHRDTHLWKLVYAAVIALIPLAILLIAAAQFLASPTARAHAPDMLVFTMGGALAGLLLVALVFAVLALRRVSLLRRLTDVGVPVLARVEEFQLLRGNRRHVVGASFLLVYEFEHEIFRVKKKTTLRAAIAQGRGQLELVVDPQVAKQNAIVIEGRLS